MDDRLKNLKGSEARDHFKMLHKRMMSKDCWALDVDLELVEKRPVPFVVARLDYKGANEGMGITFTEALAYQSVVGLPDPLRIPVYIIEGYRFSPDTDEREHRFNVYELLSADYRPNPPTWEKKLVLRNATWAELAVWENELRALRKRQIEKTDAISLSHFLWERMGPEICDIVIAELMRIAQTRQEFRARRLTPA